MKASPKHHEGSRSDLQSPEITPMKTELAADDDKSSNVSNNDLADLYTWDIEIENGGRSPKTPAAKSMMSINENEGQAHCTLMRRPLRELPIPMSQLD